MPKLTTDHAEAVEDVDLARHVRLKQANPQIISLFQTE